jgi:hypothetical protein
MDEYGAIYEGIWNHIWTNMGPYMGEYGTIYGRIWGHIWGNMEPYMDEYGAIYGGIWGHIGGNMEPYMDEYGAIYGGIWGHIWGNMGPYIQIVVQSVVQNGFGRLDLLSMQTMPHTETRNITQPPNPIRNPIRWTSKL